MTCADFRERLEALADGELGAAESAAIDSHLAACPDCAAALRELKALSSALRASPYHRAPAGLRDDVRRALRGGAVPPPERRARAVPGIIGAAVGFACALALFRAGPAGPAPDEAVSAHVQSLLSGRSADVLSSDHHQVKPWFSRHVDYSPPVPDLAADGFPLIGGRVETIAGRGTAVLAYARRLHEIDVFVRPEAGPDAEPALLPDQRGYHTLSWRGKGFGFLAVSDLNSAELKDFAERLRAAP